MSAYYYFNSDDLYEFNIYRNDLIGLVGQAKAKFDEDAEWLVEGFDRLMSRFDVEIIYESSDDKYGEINHD